VQIVRSIGSVVSAAVTLSVLAVVGWCGYSAYQHGMDFRAVSTRTAAVSSAWLSDTDALAKAAVSGAGVRPKALSARLFTDAGAAQVTSYAVDGDVLVLRTVTSRCAAGTLIVDVIETSVSVEVLVHAERPWLPPGWSLHGRTAPCTDAPVAVLETTSLSAPLGERILVDGVSGTSVGAR
jgi:hypothetical protein